jgi:hypothetical protein
LVLSRARTAIRQFGLSFLLFLPHGQRHCHAFARPHRAIRRRAALNGTLQSNVRQATHWLQAEGVVVPRNPMVGSFPGCCACAANGQAAAAPPISAMNSRRPMQNVI